jgi:hypothetical protein
MQESSGQIRPARIGAENLFISELETDVNPEVFEGVF